MTDKRTLRIEKVPASTLLRIVWNGGGEVPAALSGSYTSHLSAETAIKAWMAANDREVEIDSPGPDEQKAEQKKRGRPPIQPI